MLFERSDSLERLLGAGPFPVSEELLLVQGRPLDHEAAHARRQATGKRREIADIDQCKIVAVLRVEVRRIVILEEHLDADAEEPADFRHE